uniref:HAT C-terminal dimerisation domain-containing protein n=1 Tax=Amphiprion percula TaxID=161767 RepID=A0A3P8SG17_AMPPE
MKGFSCALCDALLNAISFPDWPLVHLFKYVNICTHACVLVDAKTRVPSPLTVCLSLTCHCLQLSLMISLSVICHFTDETFSLKGLKERLHKFSHTPPKHTSSAFMPRESLAERLAQASLCGATRTREVYLLHALFSPAVNPSTLNANSGTRHQEVLAADCFSHLLTDLKKAEAISLAIDSSCDRTDMEQLSVFARFFDGKTLREELLCLLPLTGRTTGEITFTELTQFFVKNGLYVGKIVSIVTDGQAFRRFRRSSLQHGLFRAMLDEMSAEHKDVLLHNDVRWLSKGREFKMFLIDNDIMGYVFFLCDIMSHLNCLNLQLQAFRSKVKLLEKDIQGRKLHFPRLREHCEKNNMGEDQVMQDFVSSLAKNFYERFEYIPKLSSDIVLFLRQPFSVSLWPSIDEAALQMEVLEMGTSDVLKAQHRDVGVNDCWINMVPQARFRNTRAIAMLLLTMFPSTYVCESSFSSMNSIKNQDRNRLSNAHLDQCLRIVTTEYRPDIRSIASSQCCHFSH